MTEPQYGDNSCLRFARLFGFYPSRARFGGKLSVARKADVIGREDVGKRVGNVIVIKVRAAVRRGLEAVDADTILLCFAGLWRNLSSSSSDFGKCQ